MADLKFIAQTTEQALVAATAKSLIQLVAPTNQRVKILGWGIYFDGVNTSILATPADTYTKAAVVVELLNGATAGTFSNILGAKDTNGSVTTLNGITDTVQSVASHGVTIEPTPTGVFDSVEVNPTSGFETYFNDPIILNGDDFVAIRATAPDAVNATVKLICEE